MEPHIFTVEEVKAYPPMIAHINAAFHTMGKPVIYCWGSKIYNPMGIKITKALAAHEHVHTLQQGDMIEEWWFDYIRDVKFRLAQEIPAHQAEYQEHCKNATRNMRRVTARALAERLSSPLYGNLVSFEKALKLIKGKSDGGPEAKSEGS